MSTNSAVRASPIQVDHLEVGEVRALAHRIRGDYGGIDILVNDIWGAEVLKGPPPTWNRPIWEHDLDDGLRILRLGIDTHLITSHCLHPLADRAAGRVARRGDRRHPAVQRRELPVSVFYDLAKTAVNRLAFAHGHELHKFGATAIAVTPGWLRSEMMLDN